MYPNTPRYIGIGSTEEEASFVRDVWLVLGRERPLSADYLLTAPATSQICRSYPHCGCQRRDWAWRGASLRGCWRDAVRSKIIDRAQLTAAFAI